MNETMKRVCCDVCGKYVEFEGERYAPVEGRVGEEDGKICVFCNSTQSDYALLHPDEPYLGQRSLNLERFDYHVKGHSQETIHKLFRGINYGYAYKVWRGLHPELDIKFDMCDFKEKPDFIDHLLEMPDQYDRGS